MLCLSGFEIYSRWVPLTAVWFNIQLRHTNTPNLNDHVQLVADIESTSKNVR